MTSPFFPSGSQWRPAIRQSHHCATGRPPRHVAWRVSHRKFDIQTPSQTRFQRRFDQIRARVHFTWRWDASERPTVKRDRVITNSSAMTGRQRTGRVLIDGGRESGRREGKSIQSPRHWTTPSPKYRPHFSREIVKNGASIVQYLSWTGYAQHFQTLVNEILGQNLLCFASFCHGGHYRRSFPHKVTHNRRRPC